MTSSSSVINKPKTVVTQPLVATTVHIHRVQNLPPSGTGAVVNAVASALYTDFDDEDLMQVHFPEVRHEGVILIDRYLKAVNAKKLTDDMGVIYKQMTPELGAMLSWLMMQSQVQPLLRLVTEEIAN